MILKVNQDHQRGNNPNRPSPNHSRNLVLLSIRKKNDGVQVKDVDGHPNHCCWRRQRRATTESPFETFMKTLTAKKNNNADNILTNKRYDHGTNLEFENLDDFEIVYHHIGKTRR